jgi:hypothetical protein
VGQIPHTNNRATDVLRAGMLLYCNTFLHVTVPSIHVIRDGAALVGLPKTNQWRSVMDCSTYKTAVCQHSM